MNPSSDLLRQIATVVTYVVTVAINTFAVTLPLNGLTTREISNRFPALVVPADYAFSIWSVIYIALLAFTVVQALPSQRQNALLRRLGYLPALTGVLNTLWVVAWHFEAFALTVPIMVALLVTLIAIHRRARGPESAELSFRQRAALVAPWSLYLGWITVATIANVSQMLLWAGFTGGGIPQEVWALGVLLIGVAIAATVVIRSRDAVYGAVVVWAYAAIAVKQVAPLAVAGALIGVIVIAALAVLAAWRVLDDARAGGTPRAAAHS
jgi:hypothetical protein